MTWLFLLLAMIFFTRLAGGGFHAYVLKKKGTFDEAGNEGRMPFNLSILPEICFGLCAALAFYQFLAVLDFPFWCKVATALTAGGWCAAWFNTGHGTVLQWGRHPEHAQGARKQRLTPVINFLARVLKFEIGGVTYCRTFMVVKGFLIGLPFGGVPMAILWPAAYEVGHGRLKKFALSELLSGAGFIIGAFVVYLIFIL